MGDPLEQTREAQLFGALVTRGSQFAAERVVPSMESARRFKRFDIRRLFHDAQDAVVARRIRTERARVGVARSEGAAARTATDRVAGRLERGE